MRRKASEVGFAANGDEGGRGARRETEDADPADTLAGYIAALLEGTVFKQRAYSLDRDARKAALAEFIAQQEAPMKKAA